MYGTSGASYQIVQQINTPNGTNGGTTISWSQLVGGYLGATGPSGPTGPSGGPIGPTGPTGPVGVYSKAAITVGFSTNSVSYTIPGTSSLYSTITFNSTIGTYSLGTIGGLTFNSATGIFSNSSGGNLVLNVQTGINTQQITRITMAPFVFTSPSPVPIPLYGANVQYYNCIANNGGSTAGSNIYTVDANATVILPTNYLMGLGMYYSNSNATALTTSLYAYRSTITAIDGYAGANTSGGGGINNTGYGTFMTVTN